MAETPTIQAFSVAMTGKVDADLTRHLLRADGQEDLTFALYRTSTGTTRDTALLVEVVLPKRGERLVHRNASFTGEYFLRAAEAAAAAECGLALLHSHPGASTWQQLSDDDYAAEAGHARQAMILTGKPLVGLTLSGQSGGYSARCWSQDDHVSAATSLQPWWATTVRIVGPVLRVSYNPDLVPAATTGGRASRTVHAWGPDAHQHLTRLRVGLIGAGSVGQLVGEGLARTGFTHLDIIDFDSVAEHNLDRLVHATPDDIGASKARTLAAALTRNAVADNAMVSAQERSVVEPAGWLDALDCDVLFSCVDRPWPRYALNVAAYAHLIPVVDGGVAVDIVGGSLPGAEGRAHVASPGRRCLECLEQYDPAHVGVERAGLLDDPTYIAGLPADHALRRRENVFAFSMACASAELLELFRMVVQPAGRGDIGATLTHWATGTTELETDGCRPGCPFVTQLTAVGDDAPVDVTGTHPAAEQARAGRWAAVMPEVPTSHVADRHHLRPGRVVLGVGQRVVRRLRQLARDLR